MYWRVYIGLAEVGDSNVRSGPKYTSMMPSVRMQAWCLATFSWETSLLGQLLFWRQGLESHTLL